MDAETEELARRVRAARHYADLTQDDMAHRLGVSIVTYKRIEQAKREVTLPEIKRISEITQMPEPFFSMDLSAIGDTGPQEQLDEAGERIQGLVARLEDIEFRMRQNQGGGKR